MRPQGVVACIGHKFLQASITVITANKLSDPVIKLGRQMQHHVVTVVLPKQRTGERIQGVGTILPNVALPYSTGDVPEV